MFGNWSAMLGNYEDRKVARHDDGTLIVSTALVTNGAKPYETAVSHPRYKNGRFIIVEAYDTKKEARDGHSRWVETMTSNILPKKLSDCNNAAIAKLAACLLGEDWYDAALEDDDGHP